MMTLEEAIRHYEESERINTELAKNCVSALAKNHNLENAEKCKQMIEWLRELQERRKEQYLTIEQIATAVGTQTIHSAYLWFDFARTLEILGYAVVKRRTDADD